MEGRNYLGKGIHSVTSILKGFSKAAVLSPAFRFLTGQPSSLTFWFLTPTTQSSRQVDWEAESQHLPLPKGCGLSHLKDAPILKMKEPQSLVPCKATPDGYQILIGHGGPQNYLRNVSSRPSVHPLPSQAPSRDRPGYGCHWISAGGPQSSSSSSQRPRSKEGCSPSRWPPGSESRSFREACNK